MHLPISKNYSQPLGKQEGKKKKKKPFPECHWEVQVFRALAAWTPRLAPTTNTSFLHHNPESADQLYCSASRPKIGLVTVVFLQQSRWAEEVWTDGTDWSLQQPLTDSLHPPWGPRGSC